MQSLNLGNLDLSAKRCLELMLRPKHMHVVEPWILRASEKDKRLLLQICVALHRDYSGLAVPLVKSDASLLVPSEQVSLSFDRHQLRRPCTAPNIVSGPADKYPSIILHGSSNLAAADLYRLRFTPIENDAFSSLLIPKFCSQLHLWQISILHADIDRPEVLRILRSIHSCLNDVSGHLSSRPRTSNVSLRLFQDSVRPNEVVDATASKVRDRLAQKPRPLAPIATSFLKKKKIARKPFDSQGGPLPTSLQRGLDRFKTTYAREYIERHLENWGQNMKSFREATTA